MLNKITVIHPIVFFSKARMEHFPLPAHPSLIYLPVSKGGLCLFVSTPFNLCFTYSSWSSTTRMRDPPPPSPALTLLSHVKSSSATNIGVQEAAEHHTVIYCVEVSWGGGKALSPGERGQRFAIGSGIKKSQTVPYS